LVLRKLKLFIDIFNQWGLVKSIRLIGYLGYDNMINMCIRCFTGLVKPLQKCDKLTEELISSP
jgi:hypothetical protein